MSLLNLLRKGPVFLDGGMGSLLQARGLRPGEAPETWSLTHPEAITAIHRAYLEAGSQVLLTNTFGVHPLRYPPEDCAAMVRAALDCARAACREAGTEACIALDMGPCGRLLQPYGDLDFEEALGYFGQIVRLGAEAGADCVFIETMNDALETKAAVLAAKENCGLPVLVSNAYGADGKLMTGASPEAMVALLEGLGADAVGVNCSLGPEAMAPILERYLAASSVPVLMKPNAGLPETRNGKTVYPVGPEAFAEAVAPLVSKGLRILGGCCGTSPDYIRALRKAVGTQLPPPLIPKTTTLVSSGSQVVELGKNPVLIGERINPTGKKRLRQALAEGDMSYVLREALAQEERGAQVLDVNVGAPGVEEAVLLPRTVRELQAVTELPLQLDSADPAALEAALRVYNGKAMINSVNGNQKVMEAIFPLVKKYGGVVVALTLDEKGIPATAEGRLEIARRILAEAEKWGVPKRDLVFDPLTMTVSADDKAARVTLEALALIRRETGCPTVLGVSNVSFGLPARETLGSAFLLMALQAGLSAAIMNPCSDLMLGAFRSYRTLAGLDSRCGAYIALASALSVPGKSAAPVQTPPDSGAQGLRRAVEKGLRAEAEQLAAQALAAGRDGLELVQRELIPALDEVGRGFEAKTLYLPQLMMSAEAAEAAFRAVKAAMTDRAAAPRCPLVLATVRGDIHDIGKNIVRLLLENYGYAVTDLGKDVAPERILEAVERLHAPICGLSALMTTTVPAMEETIALLHAKAPWCRVMVGGAVLTEDYAARIGADGYARDAMAAVRLAERMEAEDKMP
ncbi:MAG: homocysteine S-methyltransferase family protein [Oscillospiraceae bacterium]|nr:homocysteine S-methyltransferase family protein [Oscillospiraceae bacterium]